MSSGTQVAYEVVQPKYCEQCANLFYRVQVALRKLSNGNIIDPNRYCPRCENILAKNAAKAQSEVKPIHEEGVVRREKLYTKGQLDRMERECLRKEMFLTATLAKKVAERSRKRHHGKSSPNQFYKCRTKVDPILWPERQQPHYHIGGDNRKF